MLLVHGVGSLKLKFLLNSLIVLILILGYGVAVSQTGNQSPLPITLKRMQIKGKISIKGSGAHTYLCLSSDTGVDYRLTGALKEMIWVRYQQEMMTLEGVISKKALGPGFPAEFTVHKILTENP